MLAEAKAERAREEACPEEERQNVYRPPLLRREAPPFAQSCCFRHLGTLLGIVGGDHRIVVRQPPLLSILGWRHALLGVQMALERLVLLAILQ
jgi:hypothetical protein